MGRRRIFSIIVLLEVSLKNGLTNFFAAIYQLLTASKGKLT